MKTESEYIVNGDRLKIEHRAPGEVWINDRRCEFEVLAIPGGAFCVKMNGKTFTMQASRDAEKEYSVWEGQQVINVRVEGLREKLLARFQATHAGDQVVLSVKAPMPGLVGKVEVREGQAVKKGDGLIILEAMKMENEIRAVRDGIIVSVKVKLHSKVEKGQELLVLESTS